MYMHVEGEISIFELWSELCWSEDKFAIEVAIRLQQMLVKN